jgi:2,3-bisphosphoglycerate-independent phosphoglycerate mutase
LDGRLADVAPTILKLLGLPQPEIMTGRSLLLSAEEALPRVAPRSARA